MCYTPRVYLSRYLCACQICLICLLHRRTSRWGASAAVGQVAPPAHSTEHPSEHPSFLPHRDSIVSKLSALPSLGVLACRVLFDVQYPSLLRVPYPSARALSLSLPAFDLCVACVEDAMFMLMCLVCVEDAMFNSQGHDEVSVKYLIC